MRLSPSHRLSMVSLTATLLATVLATGCGPSMPIEAPGEVIQAVYDPAASNLPTPNDLAMQDGVVAINPAETLPAADRELKLGFNGRDGFSLGSSPKIQFSGALSAASLTSRSVVALDLGVGGKGPKRVLEVSPTWAECDRSVSLTTAGGFEAGHQYLFGVRGGPDGVKGAGGEDVVPSSAFYFLRSGEDLSKHPDAFPGATREAKQSTADRLEGLRRSLEPHFQTLEANGLPRRELVALWSFTAQTSPEVAFDPATKKLPMPNDLLRDPVTGIVTLPISASDSPNQKHMKKGFNQLDGFSLTGAMTLELTHPAERNTVRAGRDEPVRTMRLFRADTLEEVLDVTAAVSDDGRKVTFQPTLPLRSGTQYVAVVHDVLDTQARPLEPMPLASILKLTEPLVDEAGVSNLTSLCGETAARLELLRSDIAPVLAQLESAEGIERSRVAVAVAFTTQDIIKRARELWEAPYKANLPLTITEVINNNPTQRYSALGFFLPEVARVVTGKMTTIDFLDPESYAFRENGQGVPREIDFLLTFPKGRSADQPTPVVVFGHGLYTERRLGLMVANVLASKGFAMMAIDLPMHGERTACRPGTALDCERGSTCASDGRCVLPNGTAAQLSRDVNVIPGLDNLRDLLVDAGIFDGFEANVGAITPFATGQRFVDVENLFGARDHFRQAIVDLSAQTRLIKHGNWKELIGFPLDGERIYYAGISLGGIIGAMAVGVDPNIKAALLNVGGAGLPDLMKDSTYFGLVLRQGLEEKAGIVENTPEWDAFLNAARWVLDEADPVNLARFALREPLPYSDPITGVSRESPTKKVRIQMATGDIIVPNSSTERLTDALGIDRATMFKQFAGTHMMLCDPVEPAYFPSINDMASFLDAVNKGEL